MDDVMHTLGLLLVVGPAMTLHLECGLQGADGAPVSFKVGAKENCLSFIKIVYLLLAISNSQTQVVKQQLFV